MTDHGMRSGSLQFYPRKRARKVLHRVNWSPVIGKNPGEKPGFLGFIGYKVGMASAYAKDNTEDSLTKNKKIILPCTIVECPNLRIYSIRFYKNKRVAGEVVVDFSDELKKKIKKPKQIKKIDDSIKTIDPEWEDVKVLVYSNVKLSGVGKKKPDMIELGLNGNSKDEKLDFIKEKIGKDISVSEVFAEGAETGNLVDVRGVTKSYGTQGPVKRFGISLKSHKSEKGRRRPGSLAPWHPARVTFRAPQAGQTGGFSRITYNNLIIQAGKISEKDINKKSGFHKYGNIKTDYIILKGSIPGTKKRPLVITPAIRPTRLKAKGKFEVLEIR